MSVPPSDSDAIDWTLIDRYIAGGCPVTERVQVEEWLAADPSRRAHLDALRALRGAAATLPVPDTSASWARLRQRVGSAAPKAPQRAHHIWLRGAGDGAHRTSLPVAGARVPRSLLTALAAAVLFALGVSLGVRHDARRGSPGDREYTAAAGQHLGVILVDGTQLTLAPASTARIAANYGRGAGSREVKLEGEAYFTVVHDATHPFLVRARGTVVQDVGTAFDVRVYPEDPGARIAVADGVVTVNGRVEARAGDVATVATSGVTVKGGSDVVALTAWRNGHLTFTDTPVPEVMRALGRWYNAKIILADTVLAHRAYTATLADEPLSEVLTALATALGARLDERAGVYVLAPIHTTHPVQP